jgi:hypothetical protein
MLHRRHRCRYILVCGGQLALGPDAGSLLITTILIVGPTILHLLLPDEIQILALPGSERTTCGNIISYAPSSSGDTDPQNNYGC